MALQERHAVIEWNGNLREGSGVVSAGSGAFKLPVTFSARTENPGGKTSPEELIAAAQAVCYAMAFSNKLTQEGHPPTQLVVNATCSLDRKQGGGLVITDMLIDVRGRVPGMKSDGFEAMALEAEKQCPVSNALRNNLAIRVHATLET
jgi:osmotically inducible protein OsmC